eukprot:176183-Prymnesium_polylepis.1
MWLRAPPLIFRRSAICSSLRRRCHGCSPCPASARGDRVVQRVRGQRAGAERAHLGAEDAGAPAARPSAPVAGGQVGSQRQDCRPCSREPPVAPYARI